VKALFTLDGVRGLERALERGGETLRARVGAACAQTARNVQLSAQGFAPRREGSLIRAIKVEGKGLNWRVGLDNVTLPGRGGTTSHQTPAVYGVWYELGFVTRNISARPFMKPAADGQERPHIDRTEQAINAAIGDMN